MTLKDREKTGNGQWLTIGCCYTLMEVVNRFFSGKNDMSDKSKLVVACVVTQVIGFAVVIAFFIILGPEFSTSEERAVWISCAGWFIQALCWIGIFMFDLPESATDNPADSQPA